MFGFVSQITNRIDSQLLRRAVQLIFLGIIVLIGIEFYQFAADLERGRIPEIVRPPGVEVFLPISALVSLKYFALTGKINEVHPSGLVFLLLVFVSALILKKSFCGWVCPFSLLSEYLSKINAAIFRKPIKIPNLLDYFLRSIKYCLAAFFVWTIFIKMPKDAVEQFIYSPYNIISDIKMLKFFTDISDIALAVIIGLLVLSVVIKNFWCRYLCPYGAILGVISLLSAGKIRRNPDTCTKCSKCDRICPSLIQISDKKAVISDECTACLKCAGVCPEENTLKFSFFSLAFPVKPVYVCLILAAIYGGGITFANISGHWHNQITNQQYLMFMMSQGMVKQEMVHPPMPDRQKMEKMRRMMEKMQNKGKAGRP